MSEIEIAYTIELTPSEVEELLDYIGKVEISINNALYPMNTALLKLYRCLLDKE